MAGGRHRRRGLARGFAAPDRGWIRGADGALDPGWEEPGGENGGDGGDDGVGDGAGLE